NTFRLDFSKRNIKWIIPINLKNGFKEIINSNTENRGVDLSIVATSSLNALSNAFDITRKGGTILQFGVPGKNSSFEFDVAKLYSNELTFLSSYAASEIETHQALNLLKEKTVDLDFLVTHKFKLQDSQDAFDCAHKAVHCMKVIITSD
ncbi:MAG: zinc-binding dehydrogenase, partial [Nitrososphaeraceae archaeon]|nr:zinc-binding dehydrogenase [Nitrososphaeraceae archaeon]